MARAGGKDRGLFQKPKDSGVWWIRYHDHRGKERREKVGLKTQARQLYQQRKTMVREVQLGLRPETDITGERAHRITLGEYITNCLPELRQQRSWKDQERMAKTWTRLIGHFYLDEVTANHAVLRRTARLEKGISPKTCNNETVFLAAILERAATRDQLIEKNPLKSLKLLPVDNMRFRTATGSEEERLAAELGEDFDIVAVAVDTGIRRDRLFSLPWTQIDFEAEPGWITVSKAKAGSSRQVPMTKRVRAILERRGANRTCAFVFANSKGKPMDPDTWCARKLRPAMERAGIEGLWFHDLRRTFASKLARKGKGGRVLSGLLGQKNSEVTDRYAHLDPETFAAAIETLNEEPAKGGLRLVKSDRDQSQEERRGVG